MEIIHVLWVILYVLVTFQSLPTHCALSFQSQMAPGQLVLEVFSQKSENPKTTS